MRIQDKGTESKYNQNINKHSGISSQDIFLFHASDMLHQAHFPSFPNQRQPLRGMWHIFLPVQAFILMNTKTIYSIALGLTYVHAISIIWIILKLAFLNVPIRFFHVDRHSCGLFPLLLIFQNMNSFILSIPLSTDIKFQFLLLQKYSNENILYIFLCTWARGSRSA